MSFDQQSAEFEQKLATQVNTATQIIDQLNRRIVGQQEIGKRLIIAMVAHGHVLMEGLPGLAKTTAIKSLAECTSLKFKRIQFTPDLLPADVVGTQIYDPRTSEFKVKQGPIFAHLILADEINRAPAKVQSALLEAMEERQVTIGNQSFSLEDPFLVLATQNPVEQEGTYPLPEAQVDRFLFKLVIKYGTIADEEEIIKRSASATPIELEKVAQKQQIKEMQECAMQIYTSDKIRRYISELIFATRTPAERGLKDLAPYIEYGASPRASIALDKTAKVNAMLEGRNFVTPQDIKDLAIDVLRHRLKPTYEAEAEGVTSEQIIQRILESVDVP